MTQMAEHTRAVHTPVSPADPAAPDAYVLRCVDVRDETADVKTFVFEPEGEEGFGWVAGQFLTLSQEIDGAGASRCYSISSAPSGSRRLEITVKRIAGGPFSNWLHENLRPGRAISAHGPVGGFTPTELQLTQPFELDYEARAQRQRYLFLAAGSGITPIMAILRTLLVKGNPIDAVLVNSLHGPDDVIFRRDLEAFSVRRGLRVELVSSTLVTADQRRGTKLPAGIGISPGRLDTELLRSLVPDLVDREIFSCGPAGYLDGVRTMLDAVGCATDRRHEESFDIGVHQDAASTGIPSTNKAGAFTVTFTRSGRSIDCPAGSFVLDAALADGVPVPSSCGLGMCGTCKSGLLEGAVEMNHAGGIRPREIAEGKILLCCSRPTEDLVIDA